MPSDYQGGWDNWDKYDAEEKKNKYQALAEKEVADVQEELWTKSQQIQKEKEEFDQLLKSAQEFSKRTKERASKTKFAKSGCGECAGSCDIRFATARVLLCGSVGWAHAANASGCQGLGR